MATLSLIYNVTFIGAAITIGIQYLWVSVLLNELFVYFAWDIYATYKRSSYDQILHF